MEFDIDFRKHALNEQCCLNDAHARSSKADFHFPSGTIMRSGGGRTARMTARAPYGAPAREYEGDQRDLKKLPCFKYNDGTCEYSARTCQFGHVCRHCEKPNHRISSCRNNPENFKGGRNGPSSGYGQNAGNGAVGNR